MFNNVSKVTVHETDNFLKESADVGFDNSNDYIVKDRGEYCNHRVHQPVDQNVTG